jgi:hypothetical protein
VKKWKAFQLANTNYDLSHLNGHVAEYTDSRDPAKPFIYRFFVTYSFHCFTKDDQSLNASEREQLMYHAPKEARPFNFERYELSKKLPDIIKSLAQPHILVRHAGNDRFVTVKILDQEGNDIDYYVFFKVFRENKKLRIHVVSAYLRTDSLGKSKKIGFFTIAYNTLHNKPITIPP